MPDYCLTCGMEYRDDVPHPPAACANYAGDKLKKTKASLEGALATISRLTKENETLRNEVVEECAKAADKARRDGAPYDDVAWEIRKLVRKETHEAT